MAVVLGSDFFVAKGITDIEVKGVHEVFLIKKRSYYPKGVIGYPIDTHFQYKEVGDVEIIKSRTQDNK